MFCCDGGWLLWLVHVAVGGGCLLGVIATAFVTETRLVEFIKSQLLPRYSKKLT